MEKEKINIKNNEQIGDSSLKKYKVLSFKKIKEIINSFIKNVELSEKNIKEFHKIFKLSDLDSMVNFKYLSFLKEKEIDKFKKYINKYLYTLNYNEAKIIFTSLSTQEEKEIKN